MADEDTPYRLDRSMAAAKAALGVPNAKRESERLGRVAQPVVVMDDVSHLSPVSYAPTFLCYCDVPALAANYSKMEFLSPTAAIALRFVDPIVGNTRLGFYTDGISRITAVAGSSFLSSPTANVAPITTTLKVGHGTTPALGYYMEANRTNTFEFVVPPGVILSVETAGTNSQNFVSCQVVEFPEG